MEKTGAIALVELDPSHTRCADPAPILLPIIWLEFLRCELWLRPDQTAGGTPPEPKEQGGVRASDSLLQDGTRLEGAAKRASHLLRAGGGAGLFHGTLGFARGHFSGERVSGS